MEYRRPSLTAGLVSRPKFAELTKLTPRPGVIPREVIPSETILPAEVILSVARASRSEVLAESKDPYLSQLVPTFLGTHLNLTFPSFRNVGSPYPP